jgi:hypothetical protein
MTSHLRPVQSFFIVHYRSSTRTRQWEKFHETTGRRLTLAQLAPRGVVLVRSLGGVLRELGLVEGSFFATPSAWLARSRSPLTSQSMGFWKAKASNVDARQLARSFCLSTVNSSVGAPITSCCCCYWFLLLLLLLLFGCWFWFLGLVLGVSCWLLVVGCWLLVVGCWLLLLLKLLLFLLVVGGCCCCCCSTCLGNAAVRCAKGPTQSKARDASTDNRCWLLYCGAKRAYSPFALLPHRFFFPRSI